MQKIYEIAKIAKKFIVRHSSALTQYQPYVFCVEERTANAVAACLNDGPYTAEQYRWQIDAANNGKPHWCVTPDVPWVLADADEVRPGQFYIGVWTHEKNARDIWRDIVKGDDKVDYYTSGVGPIQDPGFVIVNANDHANPAELWVYRYQLKPGEAFEYLTNPGDKYVAVEHPWDENPPKPWHISYQTSAKDGGVANAKVKRIPRWDGKDPIVLPCVAPLDDFDRLSRETVEGLTGLECLARFELALRTESFGRKDGKLYVPVPEGAIGVVGGINGGLVETQIVFAKRVWTAKLRRLAAEKRAAEAQAAYNLVVCDDVDELPNMVDAP